MLAAWKRIPVLLKIVVVGMFLVVLYGLSHSHRPSPSPVFAQDDPASDDVQTVSATHGAAHGRTASAVNEAQLAQQYLAQFKQQQAKLQVTLQACMAQMQQATNQMRNAAMNGQMMMGGQPPCEASMPAWTAQEAYYETVIYQLQTGDVHSTMQQITGVQVGQSNAPSYYRPSGPGNDGGLSAVENYDRQAVRGTSIYTQEDGTERELQTEPYYYRNRATGELVSSNLSDPPNDGADYETLHPQQ